MLVTHLNFPTLIAPTERYVKGLLAHYRTLRGGKLELLIESVPKSQNEKINTFILFYLISVNKAEKDS